jgi:purine-nucleoside phosphorylase
MKNMSQHLTKGQMDLEIKFKQRLAETKKYLIEKLDLKDKENSKGKGGKNPLPEVGLVLGSGLGELADQLNPLKKISFEDIPYFAKPTVEGHSGQLIYGFLNDIPVITMMGRFHFYEGHSLGEVVYPIRVLGNLGIKSVVLTNAAGGVNENYSPGDLVLIKDHINISGHNPLIGPNYNFLGPRFPDMSCAYDINFQELLLNEAKNQEIKLQKGVYFYFTGPTYETPSEVKVARLLGGDLVGMSTVPETIVAVHQGIKVLGISCVTNFAAGTNPNKADRIDHIDHKDVKVVAHKTFPQLLKLLKAVIPQMAHMTKMSQSSESQ